MVNEPVVAAVTMSVKALLVTSVRPVADPRTSRLEYVPGTAVAATVSVSVVVVPPPVTGLGENDAVTPVGRLSTDGVMSPVKLLRTKVTAAVPLVPCAIDPGAATEAV